MVKAKSPKKTLGRLSRVRVVGPFQYGPPYLRLGRREAGDHELGWYEWCKYRDVAATAVWASERPKAGPGARNKNPILDIRTYEVEFPNGEGAKYAANVIAQNMYAQCDTEGNQYLLMESLVDYKSDGPAVKLADMHVARNGRQHMRKMTIGWKLCVQ
jgi:hypothetical protein